MPTVAEVAVAEAVSAPPAAVARNFNFAVNAGVLAALAMVVFGQLVSLDLEASRGWTAAELLLRVPADAWSAYLETLNAFPVAVKGCTSGMVYAIGDFVAQSNEGRSLEDLDRGRVLRSMLAGLLGHGPLSHFWYETSDKLFDVCGWNAAWWGVVPKVATDQMFWGPIWNATYMIALGLMRRDGLDKIVSAVKSTSIPLMVSGLRLWPAAHVVTYNLPTEHRLAWVDAVEILWVMILSRMAATEAGKHADADAPVTHKQA